MSRIVIVGGHGKVALLAAPLLVAAGHEVISVIRNPAQADDITATGASPLVLSVEDATVEVECSVFLGPWFLVVSGCVFAASQLVFDLVGGAVAER